MSAVLYIMLSLILNSCMTFRESPRRINRFFEQNKVKGTLDHYHAGSRRMEYAHAGDSTKPMILFIHGSPGSLSAFLWYLTDTTLLNKGFLITADRPGFGHSGFGVAEPSLGKQSSALKALIDEFPTARPVVLVGHSLGGPLIAKIAMDYPDVVDGLVIVAGSIDPELEPNEVWFRAPLATPFLSWILPRSLRASNEELYALKPELQKMIPRWREITCPAVVVHGRKDKLVPFGNVDFAARMLINSDVHYILDDNAGHFIPWQNEGMVREGILNVLKRLPKQTE